MGNGQHGESDLVGAEQQAPPATQPGLGERPVQSRPGGPGSVNADHDQAPALAQRALSLIA
jgi:hypothetical protein